MPTSACNRSGTPIPSGYGGHNSSLRANLQGRLRAATGRTPAGSRLTKIAGWALYALGRLAWCVALLLGICLALAAVAEVAANVGVSSDSFFYFYLEDLITAWGMCKLQLMQRLQALREMNLDHVLDHGFSSVRVASSIHSTFVELTGYLKSAGAQGLHMGREAFVELTGYFKSAAT